jgi:glutathione S-transferase
MIQLCGMALSNYYNKAKMVLLEKGVPFEEVEVHTGATDEAVLSCSPLAKIPYIRTPHGALCESAAIAEYLEEAYPDPPLLPADPWQRAKVRELCTFVDLHLELVARELYMQAFFGGSVSEKTQERVRRTLEKNIPAFCRLARFAPYLAGDSFTLADCAAHASLPIVGLATKSVLGADLLEAGGVAWKPYARFIGQRASAQRVAADRKAWQLRQRS